MANKQVIYLVVIIVAFGVGGYLLFKSFGGGSTGTEGAMPAQQRILPHGAALDFTPVEKFNKDKRLFSYPQVTPAEIGQGISDMIQK